MYIFEITKARLLLKILTRGTLSNFGDSPFYVQILFAREKKTS